MRLLWSDSIIGISSFGPVIRLKAVQMPTGGVVVSMKPSVTTAGADANGDLHGRKAGYPNWDAEVPPIMQTARYFDVVNFAPRITAPAVVTLGFIDTITPPVGIWTAFNQMKGPKEMIPMIESDHNNRTPE